MILRNTLAGLAVAILLAGPTLAEDAPAAAPAASVPGKGADARSTADAALTRLGMAAYFENDSSGDVPTLRHKASGMSCIVDADPAKFSIVLAADGTPGDDVTCVRGLVGRETLRAFRAAAPLKPGEGLAQAVQALNGEVDGARPFKAPADSASGKMNEIMPVSTARFTGRQGGKPVYARVSVFTRGDWVYIQQMIAPAEQQDAAEMVAEIELIMVMLGLMITNP